MLQDGRDGDPGETARILSGKGSSLRRPPPPQSSPPEMLPAGITSNHLHVTGLCAMDEAMGVEEAKRAASAAVLWIVDTYAFQRAISMSIASSGAPSGSASGSTPSPLPAATPDDILARASILAEALCVWGHFGLPLESLEAALRPRLGDAVDTRVLTAVFLPQLSPDVRRSGAISTDVAVAGGGSGGWQRQLLSVGPAGQPVASLGPTSAQAGTASELGLSPGFLFSLTRLSGKLAAAAAAEAATATAMASVGVGGSGRGCPGFVSTAMAGQRSPFSMSGSTSAYSDGRTAPSPLALLLQHRAGTGAGELASPIRLALPAAAFMEGREGGNGGTAMSGVIGLKTKGRSAWPADANEERSGRAVAVAAYASPSRADDASEVVWFSCGHHYSREHLVRTAVPTCMSRERHLTSPLQRTQQALALEYDRRNPGAACPECATKELGRLVAGLRPAAGAAAGEGGAAPGVPTPPPLPTTLTPPPRFQAHGPPRAR